MDIITGEARKRWSDEERRTILAEAISTGNVSRTARRHGVNPSMVFGWRKRLLSDQPPGEAPAFMPVSLAASAPAPVNDTPTIDVAFSCGARLRATGAVDPGLVAGIVKALCRA